MSPLRAGHIYPALNPQFVTFPSRRSTVHSTKGIISSTQPLANQCGLRVLQDGGNCADAAVAVAAGLAMVEPATCGIGGDMFCLFYDAKTKKVHSLNGSGRSGAQTSLEQIRRDLKLPDGKDGEIPNNSPHAATVPGAPAGFVDCVEKFGSGKLSLEQILAPAAELGEQGFPVSELSATFWAVGERHLKSASPNWREMLKKDPSAPDGYRAPRAGEIFKNPNMARTFRLLGKHGKKGFYEGEVAKALVEAVNEQGGHLSLEDLKQHCDLGTEETKPIALTYDGQGNEENGGVEVWEHPPNGQGIVALMALGILQELEKKGAISRWKENEHNSVDHLHAVIEALRIAFSDANWFIADPNVSKVPTEELIAREYLAERAKLFDPSQASGLIDHGSPALNSSDTVYFAVGDAEGNGISFIHSTYVKFGTGIVPKGFGFTVQNRGSNFSLTAGHPNAYAPGKRPYHTIIPALATNPSDGSLHSLFGVMGGYMQPQGHVQTLLNMLVFNLSPQAALDAPRICIGAGLPDEGEVFDRTVYLEDGISQEVADGLAARGHKVVLVRGYERGLFGRGQIIRKHEEDGQLVWSAGSDPRGDGAAIPA